MTDVSPATSTQAATSLPTPSRARDAGNTRNLLLNAARRRFARDGYSATTVRDIASEAGVNVALINRYFLSKEGLFEACIVRAVEELGSPEPEQVTIEGMLRTMVSRIADSPTGEHQLQLLLLLRSSGDERAEQIRRKTLQSFAEGMATAAGWRPGVERHADLMLRAQIALSAALGIVLLRSSTELEPLSSASEKDLAGPLGEVFSALLDQPDGIRGQSHRENV